MSVQVEVRHTIYGDAIVQVRDWFEDMDLCGIRFGWYDGEEVKWSEAGEVAMNWEEARLLANALLDLCDRHAQEGEKQ